MNRRRGAPSSLQMGSSIVWALASAALVIGAAREVRAETWSAPVGGAAFAVPGGQIVCAAPGGWTIDAAGRTIAPPADAAPGTTGTATVAADARACAAGGRAIALRVTAPWPVIDPASVTLAIDDGELELRGHALAGLRVRWRGGGETSCDPAAADACRAAFDPQHPIDAATPGFTWLPAGASGDDGELLFDADGRAASAEQRRLVPARTVLSILIRPDAVIDAFATGGVVPLRHADLIAAIDCAPASCVVDGGGLLVSNVPVGAANVAIRIKLASRTALRRGDAIETAPILRVPVVRCPLAVVSGPPLRGVDAQTVVVEVDGRCAAEADHLRFVVGGVPVERGAIVGGGERAFTTIRIGRTDADAVAISAMRDQGGDTSAQVRIATRAAPTVRVSLELPERGTIDFVPTNVDAIARAVAADWDGAVRVTPVDGVYAVGARKTATTVRGSAYAGGLIALRVSLHRALPAPVGDVEIATVAEPIERPIHEAATAAPLLDGGGGALVEMLCDTGDGVLAIAPGALAHVPFDRHDSCRLVLHRERLDPTMGRQRLALELDVTRVDGTPRAEARLARTIAFTHAPTPRVLWLRGAESRFDHYTLRLSQSDDDQARSDGDAGADLPAAQWSVVAGRGRARVYATSAIPTGLYRVSDRDHSGILTLNFGVLARLTWLDSLGHEGILAAEGGVLTVGLANDTSATGKSLTQVATVAGIGLSVPIANRALAAETSVNLHAWIELEPSRALGQGEGRAWAFVFGPSITVGDLGADL